MMCGTSPCFVCCCDTLLACEKGEKRHSKIEWKDPKKKNDQKEKEKRKLFNS